MNDATNINNWEPRNKFSAGDLGDPTSVVWKGPKDEFQADKTVKPLGTIFGQITGLSYRPNPQNPEHPAIGLSGTFEGLPADPQRPIIRSARVYLPDAVTLLIERAILGDRPRPDGIMSLKRGSSVDIEGTAIMPLEIEIGAVRANSSVGYEYRCNIISEMSVSDPLADIRKRVIARRSGAALPAPEKSAAQIEAPKAKGKGKGK